MLLTLGVIGAVVAVRWSGEPDYETTPLAIDADALRAGDLVFRRGRSLTSRMVLAADQRSPYSHVGIVYRGDDGPRILHAIPGEDFDSLMPLQVASPAAFTEAASAVSIRRLAQDDAGVAERAAASAWSYTRDAVRFDADFDLQSRDAMYCTELVWHAYRDAGLDLVDGVFVDLIIPFGEGPYILPSSLLDSPYLTEIFSFTRKSGNRYD